MISLKLFVENQAIVPDGGNPPVLVLSQDLYELSFIFGQVWDGYEKYAQITYISDGNEEKTDEVITCGKCVLPSAAYAQTGVIEISVHGVSGSSVITTDAISVTVGGARLLNVAPPAVTDVKQSYIKTQSGIDVQTSEGKTVTAQSTGMFICDIGGTFYFYDAVTEKFIPVRDAYRAAVKGGYAGTETQFYKEISGIADSAAAAAQIESNVKTVETNVRENAAVVTNAAETANQAAEAAEDSAQTAQDSAAAANQAAGAAADTKNQIEALKSQAIEDMDEYAMSALNAQNAAEQSAASASQSMSLASRSAAEAAQTVANKLDLVQQLRDSCSGKAMIDYASTELTASHAGAAYETVFAPMLKTVSTASAFSGCAGLKQLYLPSLENTGESTFLNCTSLTEVYLPNIKTVGSNAFEECSALTTVDLGGNVTSIGACAFWNCKAFNKLILRAEEVVTMVNSNIFVGTIFAKGAGSVYVPDALVQDYKAATNWVYYHGEIKPLSALEG